PASGSQAPWDMAREPANSVHSVPLWDGLFTCRQSSSHPACGAGHSQSGPAPRLRRASTCAPASPCRCSPYFFSAEAHRVAMARIYQTRHHGCRVTEFLWHGHRLIVLENEVLRISVLASKGADIIEYRYKPMDLDVLWHAPQAVLPAGLGAP